MKLFLKADAISLNKYHTNIIPSTKTVLVVLHQRKQNNHILPTYTIISRMNQKFSLETISSAKNIVIVLS